MYQHMVKSQTTKTEHPVYLLTWFPAAVAKWWCLFNSHVINGWESR